jgi:hypothetical protein
LNGAAVGLGSATGAQTGSNYTVIGMHEACITVTSVDAIGQDNAAGAWTSGDITGTNMHGTCISTERGQGASTGAANNGNLVVDDSGTGTEDSGPRSDGVPSTGSPNGDVFAQETAIGIPTWGAKGEEKQSSWTIAGRTDSNIDAANIGFTLGKANQAAPSGLHDSNNTGIAIAIGITTRDAEHGVSSGTSDYASTTESGTAVGHASWIGNRGYGNGRFSVIIEAVSPNGNQDTLGRVDHAGLQAEDASIGTTNRVVIGETDQSTLAIDGDSIGITATTLGIPIGEKIQITLSFHHIREAIASGFVTRQDEEEGTNPKVKMRSSTPWCMMDQQSGSPTSNEWGVSII